MRVATAHWSHALSLPCIRSYSTAQYVSWRVHAHLQETSHMHAMQFNNAGHGPSKTTAGRSARWNAPLRPTLLRMNEGAP